jgi:transposase
LAVVEAENVELRAKLGKNSQNSSKPPSSDPPGGAPDKPKKKGKKRKRGGQPGHQRKVAAVPDRVDHEHPHRPETCKHCSADLSGGTLTGGMSNHYVYEIPPFKATVHDHQCLDVQCPCCGKVTRGKLPADVPAGNYDWSVQATVAYLRGDLRQSVRQVKQVMESVFGVPISTGMVSKMQAQVSEILAPPVQEAVEHVQEQKVAYADETGWRQDKKKGYLWVAVSGLVTVFLVRLSRSGDVAKELLGKLFRGIVVTDRYVGYSWILSRKRQLCWSHLKRDFKSFLAYGDESEQLGQRLLKETRRLFRYWHRVRDGTLDRETFRQRMKQVRRRILAALEEGRDVASDKVSGMCNEMLRYREALFTFVDVEGVEPTNNTAEQAVRFGVLWRKICFGSDSAVGSRFVERFLTVRATLRAQGRDVYAYLREACSSAHRGDRAPSILPAEVKEPVEHSAEKLAA